MMIMMFASLKKLVLPVKAPISSLLKISVSTVKSSFRISRLATQGEVSTRNTQPFTRELGGKQHVFAHNGDFFELDNKAKFKSIRYRPIGNTDSETAFCYLMENMSKIWDKENPPDIASRYKVFASFVSEMKSLGISNIIYSDSEYVFIHSHKRISPDGIQLAGLYMTCRRCSANESDVPINGLQLDKSTSKDVVLVASVPLSDERWLEIPEGEIRVLRNGEVVKITDGNSTTAS